MIARRSFLAGSIILGLVAAGCSGGGSSVKRVRGVVKLDGQPLGGVTVEFRPRDKSDPRLSQFGARTDPDGSFEIRPGQHVRIYPGRYIVVIHKRPDDREGPGGQPAAALPPGGLAGLPNDVPDKYGNPESPQFERDIAEGDNDLKPFEMEREKKGTPR
jgi:hypothetical protein